jgi:hypothetical protein
VVAVSRWTRYDSLSGAVRERRGIRVPFRFGAALPVSCLVLVSSRSAANRSAMLLVADTVMAAAGPDPASRENGAWTAVDAIAYSCVKIREPRVTVHALTCSPNRLLTGLSRRSVCIDVSARRRSRPTTRRSRWPASTGR